MADVQDQQQQIINAQQAVQLAVLPPFSNKPTEDRFTATQWLQKVILHKAGATWTDRQAITHFRNALRGNVIDWFDTLADFGVDTNVWEDIQRSFEVDYHAKPTTTSIVSQLPDINQKSDESTNEYFARAMKILAELKRQVIPENIVITPLALAADQEALWAAIPEATRNLITSHTRTQAAKAACDIFVATILTSGLKPHIRSKILERNLTNPLEIKKAAATIEMLDNEKKPKSLAPIQNEDEVDAVKFGQNRFRQNHQNQSGGNGYKNNNGTQSVQNQQHRQTQQSGNQQQQQQNGGKKKKPTCTHCKKYGHPVEKCFIKYPHLRKKKVNEVEEDEEEPQEEREESVNAMFSKN